MLSEKHLKDVCLLYDQTCKKCRYLSQDEMDYNKFHCLKLSGEAAEIDEEIEEFFQECKNKNKNPYAEDLPLGDNCAGFLVLRNIEQGYDKSS